MDANITVGLMQYLNAKQLYPTAAWLNNFVSTLRPNTPLPAIRQTATFRLLATDITKTCSQPAESTFPTDILKGTIRSRVLAGPILCQVLDVEDIGQSRWSQLEAIEAKERGETTKGREVIRVVDLENEQNVPPTTVVQSKGPFKLLLQDVKDVKIYGLGLEAIEGLNRNMAMGSKLLLRNVDVRRGVVMLEPGNVQVLGGKLEALDKTWKEGRKDRLITMAKASAEDAG